MSDYPKRYPGKRWRVLFGSYDGVERFAVNELQSYVQDFLPYTLAIEQVDSADVHCEDDLILIGTADSNGRIAELIEKGAVAAPEGPQGYSIACIDSPWCEGQKVVVVAGGGPSGVVYGVQDYHIRVLMPLVRPDDSVNSQKRFGEMPDFAIAEHPLIENRGIWTWGYVIYDYKRFIDNMARCKMNMLTIWNDCPPLNSRELIDYAHSRGVKIIFGFHWGWGVAIDPNNPEHRQRIKEEVIRNYVENYRHLGMDGIYFQTFTEHNELDMGEKSTAAYACEWVNDIASGLYEIDPDLYIQFGLHATSILEKYVDLQGLDPRVVITWEDAGVIPYSYNPVTELPDAGYAQPRRVDTPEATIEYSKKLATFRENREFALVPKGWITLRWDLEFEHHGPFILGERDAEFIRQRLVERQRRWDYANRTWMVNYPLAIEFYRQILDTNPDKMTVTGLIEDGLFEEKIQPSVGLFAETIWNPRRDEKEIMLSAMSVHYR